MRTPKTNLRTSSRLVLAAGLGSAVSAPTALAQTLSWFNAAGGPASTAGNWSPAAVPGAANDLLWNLAGTYPVTFNASTTASRTHAYRRGTVTLVATSPHTVSTGITIGDTNALTGTVSLSSGTLNSAGNVVLGSVAGSVGNLNVTDDSADFIITGSTADMTVGSNGDAALSITGGGLVRVADQFILGNNSTSSPTLTVSGAQSTSPFQRSQLIVLGTSQSRLGQGGDATVSISSGALADFAGDLVVANGSASVSTLTIGGGGGIGGIVDAEMNVAGNMLLGTNTSVGTAAGAATVTLNSNGLLTVGGTLQLGTDPDGGTATLIINDNSVVEAGSVVDGAFGTLDHDAGTLRINGGTYTGHADPLVVTGTAGPTLNLTGGLSKTLAPAGAVGLVVGNDHGAGTWTGTLLIDGGADLIVSGTSKDIHIADDNGTNGRIEVRGAGSRLVATDPGDDIRVGVGGVGFLTVADGGQVLARNMLVPATALGGQGRVTVGDGGSLTTVNLAVGNSSGIAIDQFIVGGVANATDTGISIVVRETGTIAVGADGLIQASGTILLDTGGEAEVSGTLAAATLVDVNRGTLRAGTNFAGTALVDAPVRVRSGGLLEVTSSDLTVGDATLSSGFEAQDGSLISVGARTLTILDSNRAVADEITINGGEIMAPNGLEIVTPGQNGSMDGTGTFTGSQLFMESGGSVITATGADGITINGQFRNNSGTIDGTKYTFNDHAGSLNPAGWVGAGAINARVVFNAGTQVLALANMTMGLNAGDGVTFNPGTEMHLFTRNITCIDSNGLGLPSLTDMNGGTLTSVNGLVVNNGRVLRGRGDIVVSNASLTVLGIISPDGFNPITDVYEGLGDFNVGGAYSQGANSHYQCEVAGIDNEFRPMNDRIDVGAVALLNGSLDVSLINGYQPLAGDRFTILTASAVVGTFSTENLPPNFIVIYNPTNVQLLVATCPADFNEDGGIDGADVEAFFAAWEAGDASADVNIDGGIDGADVETFFAVWEAGGCEP